LIAQMIPYPTADGKLRVVSARTSRLNRVLGEQWIAAGDAAAAYDPLSSNGISKALDSGMRAAHTAHCMLNGDADRAVEYAAWVDTDFAAFRQQYALHYGQVTRWPDSPFWQRRCLPA
jgi:flavin-dependent dehydrogenase